MGVRCWQAGVVSDDERLTLDGRLALSRLADMQPSYDDMFVNGIEWDWIKWPVKLMFPFIPKFIQEAGNAGQQFARCESRLEAVLKIREVAARNAKLHGGDAQWGRVEQEVSRGGSPFLSELPHLVSFVKELSGGLNNPFLLFELGDVVRQLQVQRVVKDQILASIAELQLGEAAAAPRLRLAMVKAMASASAKYTKGDEHNLVKSGEPAGMGSKE